MDRRSFLGGLAAGAPIIGARAVKPNGPAGPHPALPRRPRITAADVNGAWAIIPTPSKPNAADWRSSDTVNCEEAARVVDALVRLGIDGILSLGTLGECGALTRAEKRAFMHAIKDAASGRIPVFAGTTSLSTRETIEQTVEARDIGLDGALVGLPMWNKADVPTAIEFYRNLAAAVPEMALCIYANPLAFKFEFPVEFWREAALIPQIVAAKTSKRTIQAALPVVGRNIRLMPIEREYPEVARALPDACTAFWSSGACCGPTPVVRMRDAVRTVRKTGNWSESLAIAQAISDASRPATADGDLNIFQSYNVQLERGRMAAAGWMRPGPSRPPHHIVPENIAQFANRAGKEWAMLDTRLRSGGGPTASDPIPVNRSAYRNRDPLQSSC